VVKVNEQGELPLAPPPCAWCNRPATLLCDYPVGRDGVDLWPCDVPVCRACASQEGTTHLCGPNGCEYDTLDHCPIHQRPEGRQRPVARTLKGATIERRLVHQQARAAKRKLLAFRPK